MLAAGCATQSAADSKSAETPVRMRGFTVSSLSPENLRDAREQWGANIVRWQLNVIDSTAVRKKISKQEAWDEVFAKFPAGLDAARDQGMTVVFSFPQNAFIPHAPSRANKEVYAEFWRDEDGRNLQTLVDAWKRIATLCADRPDQPIWFDLMNEPLDWTQMPSYPKEWPVWAQRLIDEIRAIDPVHPIVIEPGPGGLCWGFKTFPALVGKNLIYSLHQYQPQSYTHQGIADIRNTDLAQAYLERQRGWPGVFGDSGGGFWDKARIEKELQPVFDFIGRNPDARIYVGEFSVIRWAPDGANYLRDTIDIFEQHGWDWTYHAFREFNGWSVEHDNVYSDSPHAAKSVGISDRGAVLLDFMKPQASANTNRTR
jgi:endoglucanase